MAFNWGDIKGHKWNYSTEYSKIRTFSRGVTDKKFTVLIYSDAVENANNLFDVFDYDVITKQAGKLVIGDYYMKGYVTEMSQTRSHKNVIQCDITFTSDEPFWIKESTTHFTVGQETDGLNYEYNFEYDFTNKLNIQNLPNTNYVSSDFKLIIFGQATDPKIVISGHSYKVTADIEENEYLTIDSYNKTIYLTANDGTKTNLFSKRDKDSYIFEKIPAGNNTVSWDDEISFDITLIEQRSEPKWI